MLKFTDIIFVPQLHNQQFLNYTLTSQNPEKLSFRNPPFQCCKFPGYQLCPIITQSVIFQFHHAITPVQLIFMLK